MKVLLCDDNGELLDSFWLVVPIFGALPITTTPPVWREAAKLRYFINHRYSTYDDEEEYRLEVDGPGDE